MLATRSFSAARHCFTSRGASFAVQVCFPPFPPTTTRSPPPRGVFVFQLADSYQGRRFYATKERVAKFEGVKNSDVSIPRPRRSRSPHRPPRNERKLTVRRVTTPSA